MGIVTAITIADNVPKRPTSQMKISLTAESRKARKGTWMELSRIFTRAIELNPKDDAPYYNRAQAKRLKKDAAGAIADYTRAIELGSTNPAAYNNRGNARAENNDRDGAIADYTRAIELKPDYARAYYNRAVTKEAKGDKTGADADFKMAGKLDPELADEKKSAPRESPAVETVSLLDGKLKIDIPADFSRDPDDPKEPKTVAKFSGEDRAWGTVLRGTHGLTPEKLKDYLKMRVAEYSQRVQVAAKGFAPALAEEGNRHHRRPQMGGLELRPDAKGKEGLFLNNPSIRVT